MVYLIAILGLYAMPTVTPMESIEACQAKLKDIQVEYVIKQAEVNSKIGEYGISIITKDYQTHTFYCGSN